MKHFIDVRLCFILLVVFCGLSASRLVINEISFMTERRDQNEFIELKLTEGTGRRLQHCRLLIIDTCKGLLSFGVTMVGRVASYILSGESLSVCLSVNTITLESGDGSRPRRSL